ncbi:NAD(P)H-binding protein [Pedobacter sp. SYP-B3415]|uniref:NAD(P)H-binding protein n=1 Tax=Pedobacter sp. SYP-B3415 TaxID=2496641 RepID=UPI00101DB370|nr:NAD(P)H-binding protein [Pedobacter sp. SYP-B3415]
MKALVIGATGATGADLVQQLLADNTFNEVHIFVRRPVSLQHAKLHVHVVDFEKTSAWQHLVTGDAAFSCLGTTLKAAGGEEGQWRVDHDYQYDFAKAAKSHGVERYLLVSSGGADARSHFFYMKMKGELEEKVIRLAFPVTVIFQPGPLERKDSDRAGERIGVAIVKFFNRLGLFKGQRPIATKDLAAAMVRAAKIFNSGTHYLRTSAIFKLLK